MTEKEALLALKQGNKEAFSFIFDIYAPKIERYIKRLLKNHVESIDIVSNVFMKVYVNFQSYNISEPFSPWIYRIAHNESVNFIKKKRALPFSWFDTDTLFPSFLDTKETYIESNFDKEHMKKVIEKSMELVREKDREILQLFYFEDLSYEEMSTVLMIPKNTVGVRLNRAKTRIADILKKQNIDRHL